MQQAQDALLKNCANLPAEIIKALFSDKELAPSDCKMILKIAGDTLAPFLVKAEPEKKTEWKRNLNLAETKNNGYIRKFTQEDRRGNRHKICCKNDESSCSFKYWTV